MLKNIGFATAVLMALFAVPSAAQEKVKMCPAQVTIQVPCDELKGERVRESPKVEVPPPAKPVPVKADEVCKKVCLSDRAWQLSHSKCWWADSKDHVHRTPRWCNQQCAEVCRPRGFPKMAHKSEDTGEWFVFKFGHPDD